MTSSERDHELEELLRRARALYHEPGEPPREEMWRAIAAGLAEARAQGVPVREGLAPDGSALERSLPEGAADGRPARVVALADARRRRARPEPRLVWWGAAAAAVLVLGIGIGRMSAPAADGASDVATVVEPEPAEAASELGFAAREHLGRTESLLTVVRADARDGRIDPEVGAWARGLLSQTRLLMDARRDADPAVQRLLEDLELVLVQIAAVGGASSPDGARAGTELELALQSLEEGEVLSRLHAAIPFGMAGT